MNNCHRRVRAVEREFTIGAGGDYSSLHAAIADMPSRMNDSNLSYRHISNSVAPWETNPRSCLDYPSTGDGFDRE